MGDHPLFNMKSLQESIVMATKDDKKKDKLGEDIKPSVWIPSGSTVMDLVVGGGRGLGHESGSIINLCAQSQGGKSFLCAEIIANAYHKFGDKCKWLYDDCESGFNFNSKKLYGIDILPPKDEDGNEQRSGTIEECFARIQVFLKKLKDDEFGIYVIDSIDGLVSDEIEGIADERVTAFEKGKDFDKGSFQGGKPKFLSSTFLPIVAEHAHRKNCLVIIVSQLRDNVGGGTYAPKDRVSNGRALLHYCDSRVWVTSKQKMGPDDRPIGYVMEVTTKKMRGERPYRTGMLTLYFTYGIDNTGSNIDYLYDLRTAERGDLRKTEAKNINWDGQTFNRQDLIQYIEENALESELASRVIEKWEEAEREASKEIATRKARF